MSSSLIVWVVYGQLLIVAGVGVGGGVGAGVGAGVGGVGGVGIRVTHMLLLVT